MGFPTIVKNQKTKEIIGMVNETTGNSLLTGKNRFSSVAPCPYHGFKREYFPTLLEAISWVLDQEGRTSLHLTEEGYAIGDSFFNLAIRATSKISNDRITEAAEVVSRCFTTPSAVSLRTIAEALFQILNWTAKDIISISITDCNGNSANCIVE